MPISADKNERASRPSLGFRVGASKIKMFLEDSVQFLFVPMCSGMIPNFQLTVNKKTTSCNGCPKFGFHVHRSFFQKNAFLALYYFTTQRATTCRFSPLSTGPWTGECRKTKSSAFYYSGKKRQRRKKLLFVFVFKQLTRRVFCF